MGIEHWLQLTLANGLGPILIRRLLDACGSAEAACNASANLLCSIEGIGTAKANQIAQGLRAAAAETSIQLDLADKCGVDLISMQDARYPALLLTIHDPPPVLFVRGTLEDRDLNSIAIVGSRGCSFYGREQANRFGASLASIGFTVISGGARGVDSAAHTGALSHPAGRTIAVLGCGVDRVYPPENGAIFEKIAAAGALISEFPMGTEPRAEHFPRRNRIVSGMSRGVLVIEADLKSGALITAHTACEQDRAVFALPGRIDNRMSAGPHKLIREGAALITNVQELIEALTPLPADIHAPTLFEPEVHDSPIAPPFATSAANVKPVVPLSEQQSRVLAAIESPTGVDTIVDRTAIPAHVVLQELTMLSLKGLIRRVDGQTYEKKLRTIRG